MSINTEYAPRYTFRPISILDQFLSDLHALDRVGPRPKEVWVSRLTWAGLELSLRHLAKSCGVFEDCTNPPGTLKIYGVRILQGDK